ncbi:hypothetical protein MRI28_17515 [Nocardiopsis dassonvillei]|uniref:hypothetical protein n=1 Tax=Nocardiopsis dassonvillei TaxID=2014 RepID=UPI00200CF710|nr:hypothetical protein [Nocardiopsis dassonvillei]MCK9871415.1 hypothetical protein [Nocardiopsis dassonvillei]
MLISVFSAKGSPGVTTLALALALSWQKPVLLTDLDPAGSDLRPRVLPSLTSSHQLLNLATVDERLTPRHITSQVISLDPPAHTRLVLPGLSDPATAAPIAPLWPDLADVLTRFSPYGNSPFTDVIADCGRWGHEHFPIPVLDRSDVVLLVVQARLDSVTLAHPVLNRLRQRTRARLVPVLVQNGPYSPRDVDMTLGRPERIAYDPKGVDLLESARWQKRLQHSALMRSVHALTDRLDRMRGQLVPTPRVEHGGHRV